MFFGVGVLSVRDLVIVEDKGLPKSDVDIGSFSGSFKTGVGFSQSKV